MPENEDILVNVENGVGHVTLNRPKAINSLNHVMATGLAQALHAWEQDDAVHTVLLTGAGERGLCAGGDVVAIHHSAKGDGSEARTFWHDEYVLNAYIADYPKPYVAIMDGIVMGGGVGVGAHGSVRVVTDTTKMGMPEVGIGFIPDVGGTYLLARTPGLLGLHAALTGAPFSGADAIAMGFADHFVPHDDLAAFTDTLVADGVDAALSRHAVETPASPLLAQRDWIDECYTGATVPDVLAALREHGQDAAADQIEGRSPIALAVTLEAVRRAGSLDTLKDVLRQEFRTSCAALRSHDLVEGIRAQLIDKDRNPQWSPRDLASCSKDLVDEYFAPADPDLTFPEEEES
ncbi:enoyl-CoA hydratase/isomerase family protein [Mycolicibacterium madagascariense]|uniref:enoyl-CoA hydratase/isomerase family protein n=1 Tax=Mycolicibacterium madagascariense TaxID=212765 RepID=UPI0013D06B69|nr:enoyl-CoA hydratase/isomerase family protein [Mycolicibacterium madagascariense]MCV7012341.1 enoyl-CoA hydratase/isomerase family protein [Mycolicibacterium madagascariense]